MGGIPDLAITGVEKTGNRLSVTVENSGDLPLPVVLSFYNNDTLIKTITEPAAGWLNTKKRIISYDLTVQVTLIRLSNDIIPDANRKDNEVLQE